MKTIVKVLSCKKLSCLFLTLSLSACLSTDPLPESYYYLLDEPNYDQYVFSSSPLSSDQKLTVKVNIVSVADYLSQPNLVMKLENHQINSANYHAWGEDLPSGMQRVLIKDLNKKFKQATFFERCTNCAELSVYIDHFYPTSSGEVILSGSYEIKLTSNQFYRQDFSFSATQSETGYKYSVAKMRLLLSQLADNIVLQK